MSGYNNERKIISTFVCVCEQTAAQFGKLIKIQQIVGMDVSSTESVLNQSTTSAFSQRCQSIRRWDTAGRWLPVNAGRALPVLAHTDWCGTGWRNAVNSQTPSTQPCGCQGPWAAGLAGPACSRLREGTTCQRSHLSEFLIFSLPVCSWYLEKSRSTNVP